MIKKNKYFTFLILAGIFFLLSYYSYNYFEEKSQYQIDVKKIENNFNATGKTIDKMYKEFESIYLGKSLNGKNQ